MEGYNRNRFYLSHLINDYKPLFIFVQEHWLPEHEAHIKFVNDFSNYKFVTTSSDMFIPVEERALETGAIWHGTALGWDVNFDPDITRLPVLNERFCGVKLNNRHLDLSILTFTAYLPTSGKDDLFLETLSELTNEILAHRNKDDTLIIGLDSNQSSKSSRRRSEGMHQFIKRFSLVSILNNELPTFHHQNLTSESQIDHILYSVPSNSAINVNMLKHLCLLTQPLNLSSHDAIVGTVCFPETQAEKNDEIDFTNTYTEFSISKPVWSETGVEGYKKQTSNLLKYIFDEFQEEEHIPLLSELVANALTFSAENNFKTITSNNNMLSVKSKKMKAHFSPEHKAAYEAHKNVCKEWRSQGRPKDIDHPVRIAKLESQRYLQKIAREDNISKCTNVYEDLMSASQMNINDVFKKLNAMKSCSKTSEIPYIETIDGF